MSGKLRIIAFAALGLVAFGVSFMLSSFLRGGDPTAPQAVSPGAGQTDEGDAAFPSVGSIPSVQPVTLAMKEGELNELIRELRTRIAACKKREEQLEKREKRISIAGEALRKQAHQLEALRMQLVTPLARMREVTAELESTRVCIAGEEKANFKRIAAMYEKMDSTSGGQILVSMCKNEQEDDAVKILHYMSERSAGKVLSEMADRELAAKLCGKLKRIREES